MSDSPKVFGLVVEQVECFTFTVAYAVASLGWRVIIFADPKQNASEQNRIYAARVAGLPGVSVEMGFSSIDLDFLYIELTRNTPVDRVKYYARRASRIGILTYCRRPTWMRTMLAELRDARRCLGCVLRARRFVYVEGFRRFDLFGALGVRQVLGIDVHSLLLVDPHLRSKMFALEWEPREHRPYRLNFMGSTSPESRAQMIAEVESALVERGASLARSPGSPGDILWFGAARVPQDQFRDLITRCDYTLCPPGFVRLTHRVVESLLRGSIPILQADELELYDLDLKSGINCVAVPPGRWGETVMAALNADAATIERMRANILGMRENYLTIDASNRRLCRRLGIEQRQRNRAMPGVIVGLCLVALLYWAKGFRYLVDGPGGQGASDLRMRWVDQQYVLNRQNPFDVYFAQHSVPKPMAAPNRRDVSVLPEIGAPTGVGYPAWSYFSGYLFMPLSWRATRVYYAGIQLICLLWLVRWAYLQGRKSDAHCGAFCAAAVAATASFCTTLANGQYGIVVLALLAGSMQLEEAGWECSAGLLAGIACLKPNVAGPFLLCFVARKRLRAFIGAIAYLIVASVCVWMAIHTDPLETLGQMMRGGERFAQTGYGPITFAIGAGMKPQIATPFIALTGAALSLAICVAYRDRPVLVLFAVAGVAARLWTYHQTYDNLSVVFLLVALAQLAWTNPTRGAVIMLGAVGASLWLPAKFTDVRWFQIIQCLVWIGGTVMMLRISKPAVSAGALEGPVGAVQPARFGADL